MKTRWFNPLLPAVSAKTMIFQLRARSLATDPWIPLILMGKMTVVGKYTLQGINISHHGKRKIIFKMPFWGDMLVP